MLQEAGIWRRRGVRSSWQSSLRGKAMELDAGNEGFAFNHVAASSILLGRKDEAYRDLKKLLDAGCQPGNTLQGFYVRLKKKKSSI